MTKNDGGPAFPTHSFEHISGMSLRDWFAGQALAGICANPDISKAAADAGIVGESARLPYVHAAYETADAMLAERSKP